jgi:hypothetical protein
MRLYFHFQNSDGEILDDTGLELAATADVPSQTLRALEEISREDPQLFEYGSGGRVNVANGSGEVLFSLALDEPPNRPRVR